MAAIAQYALIGALIFVVIALLMNLVVVSSQNRPSRRRVSQAAPASAKAGASVKAAAAKVPVGAAVGGAALTETDQTLDEGSGETAADLAESADAAELSALDDDAEVAVKARPATATATAKPASQPLSVGSLGTGFTIVAFALLTLYLVARWVQASHNPLINMNGYATAFVWVILLASLVAFRTFKVRLISVVAHIVALLLLIYATTVEFSANPLVPALQNSVLLTLHVGFAIIASGAACVAFAGAVIYLLHPYLRRLKTPRLRFDEIGYKATVVTFPLWTIMLLFGALWANTAWGTYWSWDPKETAALVTWLVFAAYLHARVVGGWRGVRSAWLLVVAFVAVLFTLFGNYFFGGLHSYA